MKRWMKKFAAVVATAAMVCSVGMPAFAMSDFNENEEESNEILYGDYCTPNA